MNEKLVKQRKRQSYFEIQKVLKRVSQRLRIHIFNLAILALGKACANANKELPILVSELVCRAHNKAIKLKGQVKKGNDYK